MTVLVCMKWVATAVSIDPLEGDVVEDPRSWGASPADLAALELGLRIAERDGATVTVACVGPPEADRLLRQALAAGATTAVLFETDGDAQADSAAVASVLAGAADDIDIAVCGDQSLDRGSASTPAFLAAELRCAQVLGTAAIELAGQLVAERRTDRGGRDLIAVPERAVISVDGSLTIDGTPARLRRAALPAVVSADTAMVERRRFVPAGAGFPVAGIRPFRPRTRVVPGPDPAAAPLSRIIELTDAVSERTPPRTLHGEPSEAADAIVEQLEAWGYIDER